jgi:hypothetical protein
MFSVMIFTDVYLKLEEGGIKMMIKVAANTVVFDVVLTVHRR